MKAPRRFHRAPSRNQREPQQGKREQPKHRVPAAPHALNMSNLQGGDREFQPF